MIVQLAFNTWLAKTAASKLKAQKLAVVFGNTIHLRNTTREEFLSNKKWVCHELTHVLQYQRYGTLRFVILYLWESIKHGYNNNKFEKEARDNETNFELLSCFSFE